MGRGRKKLDINVKIQRAKDLLAKLEAEKEEGMAPSCLSPKTE